MTFAKLPQPVVEFLPRLGEIESRLQHGAADITRGIECKTRSLIHARAAGQLGIHGKATSCKGGHAGNSYCANRDGDGEEANANSGYTYGAGYPAEHPA